ncbi:MAG: large conductance mechanosensitive channel protein MscL [Candidatus Marsarchaeota archaeon]|nr:large conductance mechanosensitive channel protein MscL [Candidatus Marsarchaeota archaeon]
MQEEKRQRRYELCDVMSIIKEFEDFFIKGNVLDLAVAFIMGAAFNAVVTALVTDIFTPLIGIPGHINLNQVTYTLNGSTFLLGAFVNSVIAFLSISIVVFFFVIKPVSKIKKKHADAAPAQQTKTCTYCLSNIPLMATRCPFCTSQL